MPGTWNYRRIAAGGAGEVPIDFFIKQRGIKPDDLEDIDDFKNYKIKKKIPADVNAGIFI